MHNNKYKNILKYIFFVLLYIGLNYALNMFAIGYILFSLYENFAYAVLFFILYSVISLVLLVSILYFSKYIRNFADIEVKKIIIMLLVIVLSHIINAVFMGSFYGMFLCFTLMPRYMIYISIFLIGNYIYKNIKKK